jgi:hypothetical protein
MLYPYNEILQKKKEKIKTVDITVFFYVFWTFFSKIKSDLIETVFQLSV